MAPHSVPDVPPPSQLHIPTITVEKPFTEPTPEVEAIDHGKVEPTPATEQRRFSPPHMEWDATQYVEDHVKFGASANYSIDLPLQQNRDQKLPIFRLRSMTSVTTQIRINPRSPTRHRQRICGMRFRVTSPNQRRDRNPYSRGNSVRSDGQREYLLKILHHHRCLS